MMRKATLFLVVSLFLSVWGDATVKCFSHAPLRPLVYAPSTPGFTTAFSQKGLDYLKNVGIKILETQVPSFVIPNITDSSSVVAVGTFNYTVSNIHITSIDFGQDPSITIEKDQGLNIRMQNTAAQGTLDWTWKRIGWIHPGGAGSATFSLAIDIELPLKFTEDQNHLQISSIPAKVSIDKFDVKITGDAGWFYSFLIKTFNGIIKGIIEKQLEKAFPTTITEDINNNLMEVPVRQQLIDNIIFDISLMKKPLFTDSIFRLYESGDSYLQTDLTPCPESECPLTVLPDNLDDNRMIQMYMSDYVPTSLARAFRRAGLMAYNITPETVPPGLPYNLTTKVIAGFVPHLAVVYPNNPVQVNMRVLDTPKIRFSKAAGVSITANAALALYVQNGTEWTKVLDFDNVIQAQAEAFLGGWQIYGVVSQASLTASLTYSSIGKVDVEPIQKALNLLLSYGIPSANAVLKSGISLPNVPGFSVTSEDNIKYGDGYLALALDIGYNPPAGR